MHMSFIIGYLWYLSHFFTPQVLLNNTYRNIRESRKCFVVNEPVLKGNIHSLSATKWDWSRSQQGWATP